MGDFNINLLNCESHPESNDFLLMLNSFFLPPCILQPTRITERSATLIDNIFANTYAMIFQIWWSEIYQWFLTSRLE